MTDIAILRNKTKEEFANLFKTYNINNDVNILENSLFKFSKFKYNLDILKNYDK